MGLFSNLFGSAATVFTLASGVEGATETIDPDNPSKWDISNISNFCAQVGDDVLTSDDISLARDFCATVDPILSLRSGASDICFQTEVLLTDNARNATLSGIVDVENNPHGKELHELFQIAQDTRDTCLTSVNNAYNPIILEQLEQSFPSGITMPVR